MHIEKTFNFTYTMHYNGLVIFLTFLNIKMVHEFNY
jgi:hypothetical protein